MSAVELTRVAVYERSVDASLERVWENVHDWEHLPWLHRTSFSGIECEDAGSWGWRARVRAQPESPAAEFRLELLVEPDALRYVARTLDGAGRGTEIWTRLTPHAPERTGVCVEFFLPDVAPARADLLGLAFVRLYARLWDEDEAMMVRRTRELARRTSPGDRSESPVSLGRLDSLRAKLPLVVDLGGRSVRIVEVEGVLLAHAAVCPHRLGPLGEGAIRDGCVECPWHGYRFDVRSGINVDGRPLRLPPVGRLRVDAATREVQLLPPERSRGIQRGTARQ